MNFQACFLRQAEMHPWMEPQDVVKLCYQAAFGGEHILSDPAAAERYFNMEFDGLIPAEGVLYEQISEEICRVNMAVWKARGLPKDLLFQLFCRSSKLKSEHKENLETYFDAVTACLDAVSFTKDDWSAFLDLYRERGGGPIHHSEAYREKEKPAYRLVSTAFLPLIEKMQKGENQDTDAE